MTLPPGYRLSAFDRIDSTNAEASRRAADGAEAGLVVVARAQTAGRGRRGRSWVSAPGNVHVSILLRPVCGAREALALGFVAALAAAEAVRAALPEAEVALKWPNDVLLGGRKVAGCLLESRLAADGRLAWLVVGTGINVAVFPEAVERPATSLREAGATVSVATTIERYLAAFARWHRLWSDDGFAPIRQAWLGLASGLGQPIKVRLEDETLDGAFGGLDPNGGLVLETPDGSRRIITAGDVFAGA